MIQHLLQGLKRVVVQQVLDDLDSTLGQAADHPDAWQNERIVLVILLGVQYLYALYADIAFYYFVDLWITYVDVVGDAPQAFAEILAVADPALGQCEAKRDHESLDCVILRQWISSAHVGHGQSNDCLYLVDCSLLEQVDEEIDRALIDQLIAEDSAIDHHVGEEPEGLIDEFIIDFEERDKGRDGLAAGDVRVEGSVN